MELKFIKNKNSALNRKAKITYRGIGMLGFNAASVELLDLKKNRFVKFGYDDDKNLYVVPCEVEDKFTFKLYRNSNQINKPTLTDELGLKRGEFFEINRDSDGCFVLTKMKKINIV